jgi:hypothetical protein
VADIRDDEQATEYEPPELVVLGRLDEATQLQVGSVTTGVL